MRSRALIVIVALIMGLMAAMGVFIYINNVKTQVKEEGKLVEVLVAKKNIPPGLSMEDILNRDMADTEKVPQKYVASDAISSPEKVREQYSVISISEGEQLTVSKFRASTKTGLAYKIPDNLRAVSVAVDEVIGVADMIRPGDHVDIIATLSFPSYTGTTGKNVVTRVLLQNIEVLAVGREITSIEVEKEDAETTNETKAQETVKRTVTFAVSSSDAEKLVFAEEEGSVWLALLPATEAKTVSTGGQTYDSIFK